MDNRPSDGYALSDGVLLAQALARAGLYIFETADAVRLSPSGSTPERVRYLLKVLVDADWIVRLRRDLYAGTGRLPGGVDIPELVGATSLVSPAVISHMSALAYHGLTDQVPLVVTASTPKKVVTRCMRHPRAGSEERHLWRVLGIDYRYVTVIPGRFDLGQQTVWLDERFRVGITDRERTVLDLFAMPRLFGGVGEGLATLERAKDELDLERLVDYALRHDLVAVAKRLRLGAGQAGGGDEDPDTAIGAA